MYCECVKKHSMQEVPRDKKCPIAIQFLGTYIIVMGGDEASLCTCSSWRSFLTICTVSVSRVTLACLYRTSGRFLHGTIHLLAVGELWMPIMLPACISYAHCITGIT